MPSGAPIISATARYTRARLRSRACVTTPAQSLIPSSVADEASLSASIYQRFSYLSHASLLSSAVAIPPYVRTTRSLVCSCTIIPRGDFYLSLIFIFSLPRLPTVFYPHGAVERETKEKGSDEGVEKREKSTGTERESERK